MSDPRPTRDAIFTRRLLQTVVAVTAAGAFLALLWTARRALALIYVSALLSMSVAPLVSRIERTHTRRSRRTVPRWAAILAIYVAFLVVVALVAAAVLPPLVVQAADLWAALPRLFERAQAILLRANLLPHHFTLREAMASPGADPATAVNTILTASSTVAGGAVGVVTVVILSFYLLVESDTLVEHLIRFAPEHRRPAIAHASAQVVTKVSAWLQANFILGAVMGGLSAITLGLLGEPFFYVVALISAVGEVVPMVGPIFAGMVAIGLALTKSTKLAIVVGLLFIGLHELEANILVPKIMERRVGVSAVSVMIALLIGWELAGLLGAMLAIPTAAIITVVMDEFIGPTRLPENS